MLVMIMVRYDNDDDYGNDDNDDDDDDDDIVTKNAEFENLA